MHEVESRDSGAERSCHTPTGSELDWPKGLVLMPVEMNLTKEEKEEIIRQDRLLRPSESLDSLYLFDTSDIPPHLEGKIQFVPNPKERKV